MKNIFKINSDIINMQFIYKKMWASFINTNYQSK